ncbi:AI-2E family transporter [Candidatus Parcubacteria bacterium]|jgi:predicted PurR-regulated permease PerM|nr:AI-2E family transporter [Candidatus Parcubacteria bacterium]MBT7228489.1 AI-2E family transporter [Candidatus Parcubacteria bacterium]
MSSRSVSISTDTIVRVILILLVLGFLYLIKDVLALFFVAIILSSAFDPLIDWLQLRKIPRALSIVGVYVVFLAIIGGAIFLLIDPIGDQVKDMSRAFPEYYVKITEGMQRLQSIDTSAVPETVSTNIGDITKGLSQAGSSIFNLLTSIFGGVISFFMVLVITFYLTVEEEGMKKFIQSIVPSKHRPYTAKLISDIQHRMGYWLRGQLILSVIVFLMVYIGLSALGVEYALILALVAGIFEIVPFLGPWISAIPGVFFAFSQSPALAIWVAILYFVVQQIENNLIVPKVMGKTTGLNPLVVILAILMGARIGGIVGALLAVPVAIAIAVYFESVLGSKAKRDNRLED